ncbi:MAG: DNA primase [Clostridia bacterium]|nr:DNA primase [Clostridia bacterium]
MLDQTIIEELKIRNNIEDVISSYVRLSRAGKDLKGLCPFHSEKTPSFHVHPAEGYFHCFGCGAGGDVITFVMRAENLAYPEALEYLAKRAGIALPVDYGEGKKRDADRSLVAAMNREAAKYFHACLIDPKTPAGLDYLQKKRGFSMSLIRRFGLGYAPNGWDGLRNHLRAKGYTYEQMVTANLVQKSTKRENSYYDVFRDRVMVPIFDVGGNVVAFGGRLLSDGQPKYLNSAETPAFRKSKTLFALNFAKDHCAERMILCEGYMDAMALHGAGFPSAVATLGTAITPDHARLMSRYTKSVIICYDTDEAGKKAADKAFRILAEVGLEARILRVENAKDPDEFIKKSGAASFARLLDKSKSRFEYKLEGILSRHDPAVVDEKIKALSEITALIAEFPSSVERELYITAVSKKLEIPLKPLAEDVERVMRKNRSRQKKAFAEDVMRKTEGYADRINPQIVGNVASARAEEAILGILLLREDVTERALKEGVLCKEHFVTDFNRRVFMKIAELAEEGMPPETGLLGAYFTPEEMGRIVEMRLARSTLTDNGYTVFLTCVDRLKKGGRTSENSPEDIRAIIEKKRKGT